VELEAVTTLNVATDFSPYPAGRYPEDGPFNGETFRERVLLPLLEKAKLVRVNIDGVALLPSSFWEETWGGLIREGRISRSEAQERIVVETSDPDLKRYVDLAAQFLREARPRT
jgi:hypothetical protein